MLHYTTVYSLFRKDRRTLRSHEIEYPPVKVLPANVHDMRIYVFLGNIYVYTQLLVGSQYTVSS